MTRRRLLVTGASTLIGSHILHQLLGYDVSIRAVVGSHEEVQQLRQQYPPSTYPRLEVAVVPHKESAIPGAFEGALSDYPEPFDTIVHTVAADPAEDADCLARLVNLETESSVNLLRSIRAVTSRVHRVVVVTSLSPFARWLVDPHLEPLSPGGYYNQHRAAEIDTEYVLATSQASDNIIHDALWKWMRDVQARFDLVYLTAPSVYGPSIRTLENSSDLREANRRVWNICSNANDHMSSPPYGIDYFTDVRVSQR
jgi:nucleoside-diphosphate-sugar epimerase